MHAEGGSKRMLHFTRGYFTSREEAHTAFSRVSNNNLQAWATAYGLFYILRRKELEQARVDGDPDADLYRRNTDMYYASWQCYEDELRRRGIGIFDLPIVPCCE